MPLPGPCSRPELAALGVDQTEHLLQLGRDQRRAAQLRERPGLGAGEELANRHPIAIGANSRVGRLEQVDEHAYDLFGLVALEPRDAALRGERPCLQRGDDAERGDARDEHRSRRHRKTVAPREGPHTIGHGVGLREHGAAFEETVDLLPELPADA